VENKTSLQAVNTQVKEGWGGEAEESQKGQGKTVDKGKAKPRLGTHP